MSAIDLLIFIPGKFTTKYVNNTKITIPLTQLNKSHRWARVTLDFLLFLKANKERFLNVSFL
jgi:hypothetical protein